MTTVPNPLPHWHQRYAEELERYPALLEALEDGSVWAVTRSARLAPLQAEVLQRWGVGESEREIAAALRRTRFVVRETTQRALFRVLQWLVRGGLPASTLSL